MLDPFFVFQLKPPKTGLPPKRNQPTQISQLQFGGEKKSAALLKVRVANSPRNSRSRGCRPHRRRAFFCCSCNPFGPEKIDLI